MSLYGLLFFGLIAGLANLLGGLLLLFAKFFPRWEKLLKYLIALGIGYMLAVIFIEILPKTLGQWQELTRLAEIQIHLTEKEHNHTSGHDVFAVPMMLFLAGYLFIYTFEQIAVPHFHLDKNTDHSGKLISSSMVYAAVSGLLVHTFFDGVSLAAAAINDFHAGLLVFIAICLHKIPEGFTVASLFAASGKSIRFSALMSGLAGMVTFLGVLSVIGAASWANFLTIYTLPFAAGVTLYVAGTELLPELKHREGNSLKMAFAVSGGVIIFWAIHKILENFIEH